MSEVGRNEGGSNAEAIGRKEWVKPALKIMSAGSAELRVGVPDDGVDPS
jgi:hypothetical protein